MEDQNFGCDLDAWIGDAFVTDNRAGASNGGPGSECIR
jgi:hypothetical protein